MSRRKTPSRSGDWYTEIEVRSQDSGTLRLGCMDCEDREECGGLTASRAAIDCMDFCQTCNPNRCGNVCPRKPDFHVRIREVGGFDLKSLDRARPEQAPAMPRFVPLIMHGSRRHGRVESDAVAVRLRDLFSARTGKPKFADRQQLAERFHFSPSATLLIVGVSKDPSLEAYWGMARDNGFPSAFRCLEPASITCPNFSLFTNVPRWTDLHSMKRIAICWQEMADAGLSTSLHVNARTRRDWERWTEFVSDRVEVTSISCEFGTGAAHPSRGRWHAEHRD